MPEPSPLTRMDSERLRASWWTKVSSMRRTRAFTEYRNHGIDVYEVPGLPQR